MRFAVNAPRLPWRVILSLLNGGNLFMAGFDRTEAGVFRITIGVKNRFGEPVWFREWQGEIGKALFDSGGNLEQKVADLMKQKPNGSE